MAKGKYFADIHIHPTIKTFNSGRPYPRRNLWDDFDHNIGSTNPAKFAFNNTKGLAKYSQTNFCQLAKGRVRVATASLYPMEKGFLKLRNIPSTVMNGKARDEVAELMSGNTIDSIRYLRQSKDYFGDLQDEYNYIRSNQGQSPDGKYAYKLVNNNTELLDTINEDDTTLAIILSIEGAHVLWDEEMMTQDLTHTQMKKKLEEHIGIIKSWEVPPLTVNLAHHFYNHLCGHSRSFSGPARNVFNQNRGLDTGITGLGLKVLKEFSSAQNGKRIIVDTKHMSVKSRIEYYKWIRGFNYISKSDKIPVISSHTGVNGFKTMSGSTRSQDNNAKYNAKQFNSWSLNISDEEIKIIHDSTGLIGIMLDKHKLCGGAFFKSYIDGVEDEEAIKEAFLRGFFNNVYQVIKAVDHETAWNSIAIGSDYDGAIEHVDPYDKASTFPTMYEDMIEFLEKTRYGKRMWYHFKPEEIVDKIMRKNAMDFYEMHFV